MSMMHDIVHLSVKQCFRDTLYSKWRKGRWCKKGTGNNQSENLNKGYKHHIN